MVNEFVPGPTTITVNVPCQKGTVIGLSNVDGVDSIAFYINIEQKLRKMQLCQTPQ